MSTIQMGNDEFILYVRKHTSSDKSTPDIGKKIWEWLLARKCGAVQIAQDMPCVWGNAGDFIKSDYLPKTATQFQFDRSVLPELYTFLDDL